MFQNKKEEMTSQTAYHTCIGLVMSSLFCFAFVGELLPKSTLKINSPPPPALRWENMTELPGSSGHTERTLSPLKYTVLSSQHSCLWKVSLRKVGLTLPPQ